jgi:hypothetical protein
MHVQTHILVGFMKYAVEMSSGAMIYIPSSVKTGSGIQKLIGGGGGGTDTKYKKVIR